MQFVRSRRGFLQAAATMGSCVAMCLAAYDAGADETVGAPATVTVASGPVVGVASNGVMAFKGIPYAAPPVGVLRWRPPSSPAPWTTPRAAIDYGHACPQVLPLRHVPPESRAATTSEDCLTLNVWTPGARAKPMPVMVWIHGGGNVAGTASDRFTDGSTFARDGVVLVSFEYRLGLLGFFAHPSLAGEPGGNAANFGLLDQIAALRWVRDNSAAFGGDPTNVTIFGESAGGEDVVALAASDAARGLFRHAIAESAADLWSDWPTLAKANARGAQLATRFGLAGAAATAEQLRALPADTLVNVRGNEALGPIVDGTIVAAPPVANVGRSVRVPLVIGTNGGEGSLVDGYAGVDDLFPALKKSDLAFVRARYAKHGVASDAEVTARLFRDGAFAAPARWAARSVARAGHAAYVYRFEYVLSGLAGLRSAATHGSEIPFVFENWPIAAVSAGDRRVGAALHDCWIAFARSGAPACATAPAWKPYDARNGRVMVIDAHPAMRDPGDGDVLDVLERRLLRP